MRMLNLALLNFKNSFRNYLSLVVSLAFTIMIFLNFQNILYSDSLVLLGERNKSYVDTIVQVVSVVLVCFMFFFIWYSTNVFLTRRKKEIGIYVFMGLTNQKIGKLYMIEITLIGLSALALGIFFGVATTGLFQMILLALSDLAVEIRFQFVLTPVLITAGAYLGIYLLFVAKGYVDIVRSSVLDMFTGARQNEYVRQKSGLLFIRAVLGVIVLGSGFYFAVKESGQMVLGNVTAAVVLVIAGVYLLFGGLIPFIFQGLAGRKSFLYRKERCLWVNNVIFRIKKNYRTYAMVCVLVLCSVTALATGFAMKTRYENMVHFENTYTFQLLSEQKDLDSKARELIEENAQIACSSCLPITTLEESQVETTTRYTGYAITSWSAVKKLAEDTGLEFELTNPGEDEYIKASNVVLLSLITDVTSETADIDGKVYHQIQRTQIPYLGYLQERHVTLFILNDDEFERMRSSGRQLYVYNYRIADPETFDGAKDSLSKLVEQERADGNYIGRVAIDPNDNDDRNWIKVLYSLCVFMFMVFILASGSIMFMKLYNDSFEEKERYLVMKKLGFDGGVLGKSISHELAVSYSLPFLVMSVASYFSVHALEKMMFADLRVINIVSVLVVGVIFLACYGLSVAVYRRNVGV